MLPLLLRVAMSLSASWHLTALSPSRVVAAIAAAGGTVAAIAALMAPSTPPPRAGGAAADSPVESVRPMAADDPGIFLGWADVPEWRPRRPQVDDLPNRRRRHTQTAPHRRSPTVAERQAAEPHRAPRPTDPAPEAESDRTLRQAAAPPSTLPGVEFAFAGPHMTAGAAHAAAPEKAPRPTPDAELSPEPTPRSEPTTPPAAAPASPPTAPQYPPTQPPALAGPATGTLAPQADTPRTPAIAPRVAAPVRSTPDSKAWPSAPRAVSGPSAAPGGFVTPPGVMPPLMPERTFAEDFSNGVDDIAVAPAKGVGRKPMDLVTGSGGLSGKHGRDDDLVKALLDDDFDSGNSKAFDVSSPADTIDMAFDVPAFSSGNAPPSVVDLQGGDELRSKTVLRPMAIGIVPEPGTAPLLALGLAALARRPRRKIRR